MISLEKRFLLFGKVKHMHLDVIQAAIIRCLAHDVAISKPGMEIVEGDKFSLRVNASNVTELEYDKGNQFIYFFVDILLGEFFYTNITYFIFPSLVTITIEPTRSEI